MLACPLWSRYTGPTRHVRPFEGRVAQRESTSLTSRGSQVRSLSRPPPSHRDRTPFSFFAQMPPERGLFESQRVSVSVSKRRNGGFYAPVSASKISVPGRVRDRFDDDCVGGWQFGPFRLHHPVLTNRTFPGLRKTGRFCGDSSPFYSSPSVSGNRCGLPGRFRRPVSASKNSVPRSWLGRAYAAWQTGNNGNLGN